MNNKNTCRLCDRQIAANEQIKRIHNQTVCVNCIQKVATSPYRILKPSDAFGTGPTGSGG